MNDKSNQLVQETNVEVHVNKERCAKAYFFRLFTPYLFLIPLIYFGLTTGAVIATVVAIMFARRVVEHHYSAEFGVMYMLRHQNLTRKRNNG